MSSPASSIATFNTNPNIIALGESSVLKWSVTGDEATVTIGLYIGSVALSGTRVVTPEITTNYTLTANNDDQQKIASVQIVVKEKNESRGMFNEALGDVATKTEISRPQQIAQQPVQEQKINPRTTFSS